MACRRGKRIVGDLTGLTGAASDHRLAGRYELIPIFSTLSAQFRDARMALNDVAQRLFTLGGADARIDNLLLHVKPDAGN